MFAFDFFLIAYFSPETLLPVGSILATVAGIALMLGRGSLRFLIRCFRSLLRPSTWVAGVSRPHFRFGAAEDHRLAPSESPGQTLESTLPN